jgi:cell wall-associated NlpC family hydrolase
MAAAVIVGGAGPAAADIHQEIASARAQLDRLNNQSEAAAERYNAARIKLAEAEKRATLVRKALGQANADLTRQTSAVSDFARESYESGGLSATTTLISEGSAAAVINRVSAIQAVSMSQQKVLASFAASRRIQAAAQQHASAVLTQQREATQAALKEKETIQRNATEAQHLLATLREKELQLNRQAEAARLAAEAARAAQAAQAFASQSLRTYSPGPAHYSGSQVGTAIAVAREQLGKPYVWGGSGPDSFDCSGLTMYAYGKAGISLPHYTNAQYNEGRHVSEAELQPGDLVFFNTDAYLGHEGMYLGNGQFIHAPHSGDVVKISELSGYYQQVYAGAVRLVG